MPLIAQDPVVSEYVASFEKIEALQEEARKLLLQIQDVYAKIGDVASGKGARTEKYRLVSGKAAGGQRAPRGALKAAIHKILAGGQSVRPADVVRALPRVGYRSVSKPRVLYTSVYLTLKRDKKIKKTPEGFKLKAAAKSTRK